MKYWSRLDVKMVKFSAAEISFMAVLFFFFRRSRPTVSAVYPSPFRRPWSTLMAPSASLPSPSASHHHSLMPSLVLIAACTAYLFGCLRTLL